MQNEFTDVVFDFVKSICNIDNLLSVVLFGSVAKEEADRRSDVDLLIVFNVAGNINKLKEKQNIGRIALELEKKHDRNIQLVFSNKDFEGLDRQFVETAMKEGIILYGKNPKIETKKLGLEPFYIVNYNTKNVPEKKKMKLNRVLYGYHTTKRYKNKKYRTEVKGLVKEFGIKKIGLATLLVPYKRISIITKLLKELGINYNQLDIWVSKI